MADHASVSRLVVCSPAHGSEDSICYSYRQSGTIPSSFTGFITALVYVSLQVCGLSGSLASYRYADKFHEDPTRAIYFHFSIFNTVTPFHIFTAVSDSPFCVVLVGSLPVFTGRRSDKKWDSVTFRGTVLTGLDGAPVWIFEI